MRISSGFCHNWILTELLMFQWTSSAEKYSTFITLSKQGVTVTFPDTFWLSWYPIMPSLSHTHIFILHNKPVSYLTQLIVIWRFLYSLTIDSAHTCWTESKKQHKLLRIILRLSIKRGIKLILSSHNWQKSSTLCFLHIYFRKKPIFRTVISF